MGKTTFVIVASLVAMMCVAVVMLQSLLVLQRVAHVSDVIGDVKVRRQDSEGFLPLTDGSFVRSGDIVRTGKGSAVLRWVDGTRLRLSSFTTLQVLKCQLNQATDSSISVFKLNVGRVWVRVRKLLSPRSKFEVITPTATAGVRGTVFSVEVDPTGRTRVAVAEGAVAVQSDGRQTVVPRQKMAVVSPSGRQQATVAVRELEPETRAIFNQLRDVLGPYLSLRQPAGPVAFVRDGRVNVVGRTEPGVQITVNGRCVEPNSAGWFRVELPAKAGQKLRLRIVAVDDDGYRTVLERQITVAAAPAS